MLVRDGLVCSLSVDALAQLLMWSDGEFSFDAGADVPEVDGVSHVELIEAAQAKAASWRTATAVLPDDDEAVMLVGGLDGPVTLDPRQWALVTRIDGRCQVQDLCDTIEERTVLAGLIQQGLAESVGRPSTVSSPVRSLSSASSLMTSLAATTPPRFGGGTYDVVGSLAMKPDVLLELAPVPGIHEVLLKRLVVGVRGL